MNEKQILSTPAVISDFIRYTNGNWRSSVYISCRVCKYSKLCGCGDFLFIADERGAPLLLPHHDAALLFGRIDKSDCLMELSNLMFREIFKPWFQQAERLEPSGTCPYQKLSL